MSSITTVRIKPLHLGASETVSFNCADLSVKQTVTPEWASEAGYGKMDPIATYGRTSKTATINMIIVALNSSEAVELQESVDNLYKINYPAFAGATTTLAAPPFFQVDVLQNRMFRTIKGYFTEVSIEPGSDQEIVPLLFEGKFYERRYNISLGMVVMHSIVPGWGAGGFNSDGGFVYINEGGGSKKAPKGGQFWDKIDNIFSNAATTSVSDLQDTVGLNAGSSAESLKDNLTKQSGGSTAATTAEKDTSD